MAPVTPAKTKIGGGGAKKNLLAATSAVPAENEEKKYCCHYPQLSRDWMSPVCRIFFLLNFVSYSGKKLSILFMQALIV